MTNLRYGDKVAVITGGRGIGKGCAYEFVKAGAKVVLCCNNEEEGLTVAGALQSVGRAGGAGDIASPTEIMFNRGVHRRGAEDAEIAQR